MKYSADIRISGIYIMYVCMYIFKFWSNIKAKMKKKEKNEGKALYSRMRRIDIINLYIKLIINNMDLSRANTETRTRD